MSQKHTHPSPNGKQYEYEVRLISFKDWGLMNPKETLDKFGQGGWRLCTKTHVKIQEADMWEMIFSRELNTK